MTSYVTKGYAQVDFRPNQIFTDVTKVCWDQNKTDMTGRQWTQVVVISADKYQSNTFGDQGPRMDYVSPRMAGVNRPGQAGVNLSGDDFMFETIGDSRITHGPLGSTYNYGGNWNAGSDRATRYTNCVTDNENGTVTMSMERAGETRTYTHQGAMPDGDSVVIFQDDNYNSAKDGAQSFTFHWDNIIIS